MPELPEVEVVRRGLDDHVVGRRVTGVTVHDGRSLRRYEPGAAAFGTRVTGRTLVAARRRGKFLWLPLDDGAALTAHLGMSGQMLVASPGDPPHRHLRVAFDLDDGRQLRFVDQRIFGGLAVIEDLIDDVPSTVAHIALDPLDPAFDPTLVLARLRKRETGIKRALLDQTLVSGVGNIYADEALWRVPLHYARNTRTLRTAEAMSLLGHVAEVMREALDQGGTSFDSLYVNVNGQSGYFDRSLHAYGREDRPCDRCGALIRRSAFMNRSSYWCPSCQPRPRNGRW